MRQMTWHAASQSCFFTPFENRFGVSRSKKVVLQLFMESFLEANLITVSSNLQREVSVSVLTRAHLY